MINKLMKLSELGELLEYDDTRSIINWCKNNKILVMHIGKAKYVTCIQIELLFENKLKQFANKHYQNPDEIMDAYHLDDKVALSESMDMPVEKEVKKKFRAKKVRSESAREFLNRLKSA